MAESFIFGAPGLAGTPAELAEKRKAAYGMISRALGRAPKDAGEGLNAIGQALIARTMMDEASASERAGRAQSQQATSALAGLLGGGTPAAAPTPDVVTGSNGMPAGAPAAGGPSNAPPGIIGSESGGNWRAQNAAVGAGGMPGHFGRIQFGQARLQEAMGAGALPPGTTPQQFMDSPQFQESAERWHWNDIDRNIQTNGLNRYVGQNIGGVPVTLDGMRAVAHLGGSAGLRRFLESGGRYNPRDANGTSLLNYLQRHASQRTADAGPAVPQDVLTGGDGSEEAPLIDGRNLPVDTAAPALQRPAMNPAEAFAAPMGPSASGGQPPLVPTAPLIMPGNQADMMTAQPAPPIAAPVPQERPTNLGMMQAPVPQPRPDMQLPPGAQPAGPAPVQRVASALSERDRLMLLRDEGSLAPGEAQSLRSGLPGPTGVPPSDPVHMVARALQGGQGTPSTPPQAPQTAPMPQGAPAPVAAAPQAAPGAAPQAAPGANPQQRVAAALAIMNNPWAPPGAQAAAQSILQNAMRSPEAIEQERLQTQSARLGVQQTQRTLAAPLPNSPEALQAQVAARASEADRLGLTGAAKQRYSLTGQLPEQTTENIPAQIRAREAEATRLGLRPGTPEYQNYALTGRFRDSPELSTTDRKAIMDAEDQVPIIQNTIGQLQRARTLNRQAYSGAFAGYGTAIGTSGVPLSGLIADPKRAEASREFNQIMSGQAVEQMSAILKGATTDREMAQFKEILGNPSTPPDIRERTIDRMVQLAERQMQLQQTRIQQLRGRDYFRPNGGQPGAAPPQQGIPPAPAPAPAGIAPPKVDEVRRGYRFKGGDPADPNSWERAQ
jgi:hypothetical protein